MRVEFVVLGLDDAGLASLTAQGYTVVFRDTVAVAGAVAARLRAPAGVGLAAARAAVTALDPAALLDVNHLYRTGTAPGEAVACAGRHCPDRALIGWPLRTAACAAGVRIGIVDTGINAGHASLAGRVEVVALAADPQRRRSSAQHGTAVAALLVGAPDSRTPGLLDGANLVAVDAFHRAGGDERADAYDLVRALDILAARNVSVINLSLAGPANDILERMVGLVAARGIALVAAVGNAGPRAAPAYPAAYDGVVAVTAVDRNGRVYRRAGQGAHVDLAAPGVNVWTAASVSGGRPKTGTSFAAPFVTAAVALARAAAPQASPAEIEARLAGRARDLGAPGPDRVFGAGLVQAEGLCD